MHDFTSYGCSPSLIEDIRKAHYKKQAELCLTFCKLIKKLDKSWQNDMFIKRFMETSRNIDPHNLDDTIEWVSYAINDMDNAISNIDRNDPMTFFDLALSLEKTLKGK